jgi:hypothetical protein
MTRVIITTYKRTVITTQQLLFLHKVSAFKPAKGDVDAVMILEPYPARLASSKDPVPEFLYGWVRSADAKHRGLNAEVPQIFKGRKCLVAEEGGQLFEKRKKCWAAVSCKSHAQGVRYACIDVSYSDEFHTRVMR